MIGISSIEEVIQHLEIMLRNSLGADARALEDATEYLHQLEDLINS